MWFFLSLVVEGALAGAIYALIALAFVLVYKASGMVNFALGEWIMMGALLAGIGLHVLQLGAAGALGFAGLGMLGLAALFCRLVVRRLVARPVMSAVMVTIGLGMVLRGIVPFMPNAPGFVPSTLLDQPLLIDQLSIPTHKLAAAAIAVLCIALIGAFYQRSRTGIAMRAMADDPEAAMAAGIDTDFHLLLVWGLVGLVSVVAGVLWVWIAGSGFGVALVGLKIFPIVIIGGLDSIAGTIIAAISIGMLESLSAGYLDPALGSGFGTVMCYLALLAMLIVRPHGLFGQRRIERV